MVAARIIPVLLLAGSAAVKTRKFKDARYVGDILNAAQIFNDKLVDELMVLDVEAWKKPGEINPRVKELAEECFMPLTYGGGVNTPDQAAALFRIGIEKICINTAYHESDGAIVAQCARRFGSQAVVVGIDVRQGRDGRYRVYSRGGTRVLDLDPVDQARRCVDHGAGEIVIQSIDRDGTRSGYDLDLVKSIAEAVPVPVIALGGANSIADLVAVTRDSGASTAAAGSMFVFYGPLQSVLITYPHITERQEI